MQDFKTYLEKASVALTGNKALYNLVYSKADSIGTTWRCPNWLKEDTDAKGWLEQYEFFNHMMLVKSTQRRGYDDLIEVQYVRDSQGTDVTAVLLDFIGNKPGDSAVEPNELDWLTMLLLTVDYLIEKEN